MSKRSLLSVALKVVGVVTFAKSLVAIPWTIEQINMTLTGRFVGVDNKPLFILMSICGMLAGLLVGAYLAAKGDSLARYLEPDDRAVDLSSVEWVRPAFGVAARVVGIVLIALALPNLIQTFAQQYLVFREAGLPAHSAFSFYGDFWTRNWAEIIRYLASILVGVYLVFGTASLSRLVFREPRNGTDATAE